MSHNIIFPAPDGATYAIPDVDDEGWGQSVTNFLTAIPAGVPPRSGTFSLTGDLSFGPTFGLVSQYYKSSTSNIASAGIVRLAKTDLIEWRNTANSGNLTLGINGSDALVFNGSPIGSGVSSITGTANEIIASSSTGAVTLSTPQAIAPTSSPTFQNINLIHTGVNVVQASFAANSLTNILSGNSDGSFSFADIDNARIWLEYDRTANNVLISPALKVPSGGTGDASFTAYSVVCGGTTPTNPLQNVSGIGTTGQVLTSNGAATLPTWQTPVTGSGTVNSGTANHIAYYPASAAAVSSLSTLLDSGSNLQYTGVGNSIVTITNDGSGSSAQLQIFPSGGLNTNIKATTGNHFTLNDSSFGRTFFDYNGASGGSISIPVTLDMGTGKIINVAQGTTTGDALSFPATATSVSASGTIGSTTTTVTTTAVTTTGGPVLITYHFTIAATPGGGVIAFSPYVLIDGTEIAGSGSNPQFQCTGIGVRCSASGNVMHTPSAGAHTYTLGYFVVSGTSFSTTGPLSLATVELKV